jgi:DNA-binding NtrC family response regulator
MHAALHLGATIELEDLGSHNGTWVNGTLVPRGARIPVALKDLIHLGSVAAAIIPAPGRQPARGHAPGPDRGLVLPSPRMQAVYTRAERLARGRITVLIQGETGVGKELVAEKIHRCSPRRLGPLVRVSCGTLNERSLESAFFGHTPEALTGAHPPRADLLQAARGGTLFLDEVGELSRAAQKQLLHCLESGEPLAPVAEQLAPVDVRFIAATSHDLLTEVAAGRFREDLFYRLSAAAIDVPPLRERPTDIVPLARRFLGEAAELLAVPAPVLEPAAVEALLRHPWPGNVRELRNVIERAVLICDGRIDADALEVGQPARNAPVGPTDGSRRHRGSGDERAKVLAALQEHGGNQTLAARTLGISRVTLAKRMDALGIQRPRRSSER